MASSSIKNTSVFADLSAPWDNSKFQQFLDLFEDKDRDLVRDVLWKLNAPANLGMIGTIGKRLERVLKQSERLEDAFSKKLTDDKVMVLNLEPLQEVREFCQLLGVNRVPVEQLLGAHAFSEPDNAQKNPLNGKSIRRHGFYAALLNVPEFIPDRDNWDLIVLRLLLANFEEMQKWGRTNYETYGGANEEAKEMPVKLYTASMHLRQLTKEDFKHLIGHLTDQEIVGTGRIQDLVRFANAEQWLLSRGNELDFDGREPRSIKIFDPIIHVLKFCNKSEHNSFRTGGTRIRGSRSLAQNVSKHFWGPEHILIEGGGQIAPLEVDQDDEFEIEEPISQFISHQSWDDVGEPLSTSTSPLSDEEKIGLDLSDEEIGDPGMVTGVGGQPTSRSGKQFQRYAALGKQRALALDAQFFGWQKNMLTFAQVELLQRMVKGRVENLFEQKGRFTKDDFLEELQSNLLILIILWTGSRLEKVITLQRIFKKDRPDYKECSLGYYIHTQSTEKCVKAEWWFEAIQPPYQQKNDTDSPYIRQRNIGSYVPDIFNVSALLQVYTSEVQGWKNTSGSTRIIFDISIERATKIIKRILKEIEAEDFLAQGITLRRIEKFMFQYLAFQLGDVTAASVMVGEAHNLAQVRLFYTTHDQDFLRDQYCKAISPLYKGLMGEDPLLPEPLKKVQSSGARACITKEAYKAAVAEMQEEVVNLNGKLKEGDGLDFCEFHNKYTTYIFWMFAFSTALRAIRSPDIRASIYDSHDFSTIVDKDTVPSYHARISWLPKFVRKQVDVFETYCQRTAEQVRQEKPSDLLGNSCFYLGADNKAIEVRPKTILPKLPDELKTRVNGHRRFLRTELIEAGMNVESVDCFMGHWFAGEEPWAEKASMNMYLHIQQLESYLVPLLRELGFDADLSLELPA